MGEGGGVMANGAQKRLCRFLGIWDGSGEFNVNDLFEWNDTPGRTAAEVCAALRNCADR